MENKNQISSDIQMNKYTDSGSVGEHRHHSSHHHSSRRHGSSRHRSSRRKSSGFVRYKIKHFFQKYRRQRISARRNPNRVERRVFLFWILAVILLMIVLIPVSIWLIDIFYVNSPGM